MDQLRQSPARPKRILLADDDAAIRTMMGRVLSGENYEVILAKTGREAASLFISEFPDLILMDLNMPDKDGWEALRLVNSLHPMLPVIVITARPNQYENAVRMKVDAIMEKPLDLPLLLQTIKQLISEPDKRRIDRMTGPGFTTTYLPGSPASPS